MSRRDCIRLPSNTRRRGGFPESSTTLAAVTAVLFLAALSACSPEEVVRETERAEDTVSAGPDSNGGDKGTDTSTPDAPESGLMDSSERVELSVEGVPETVAPDERHPFEIRVAMQPGWHVMANPASLEYLIPTELTLPDTPAAIVEEITYPEGESFAVEALEEPVDVYKDTVAITATLRIHEDASPGNHRIAGTLRVQACDDTVCLAPATLPVEVAFRVEAP